MWMASGASGRSSGVVRLVASLTWAGVLVGLTLGSPALIRGEDADPPLTPSKGPYRGRVVELLTEKPLRDALVILVWQTTAPDAERRWPTIALRETTTDADGTFTVDASDIEATPPRGAGQPRLLVYKPGYVALPRSFGVRFGVPVAWLTDRRGVIALKPASGAAERVEAFNTMFFMVDKRQSAVRSGDLPLVMKFFQDEIRHFEQHADELDEERKQDP